MTSTNGRGGYHILVLFDEPVPAATAWKFGRWLVRKWKEHGLAEAAEVFPKQPAVGGRTTLGNWVGLPGRHHTLPFCSKVWDGRRWLVGDEAVKHILRTKGRSPVLIPADVFVHEQEEADVAPQQPDKPMRPGLVRRRSNRGRPVDKVLPS